MDRGGNQQQDATKKIGENHPLWARFKALEDRIEKVKKEIEELESLYGIRPVSPSFSLN